MLPKWISPIELSEAYFWVDMPGIALGVLEPAEYKVWVCTANFPLVSVHQIHGRGGSLHNSAFRRETPPYTLFRICFPFAHTAPSHAAQIISNEAFSNLIWFFSTTLSRTVNYCQTPAFHVTPSISETGINTTLVNLVLMIRSRQENQELPSKYGAK